MSLIVFQHGNPVLVFRLYLNINLIENMASITFKYGNPVLVFWRYLKAPSMILSRNLNKRFLHCFIFHILIDQFKMVKPIFSGNVFLCTKKN